MPRGRRPERDEVRRDRRSRGQEAASTRRLRGRSATGDAINVGLDASSLRGMHATKRGAHADVYADFSLISRRPCVPLRKALPRRPKPPADA